MYNQPFSQPPGMFGAQSAMAQMQSAPSLPAGNPGAREYFNYSMETLSNAAMPQAMMPQGISSLVPQYQFGGDVSLADAISIASNAPNIESAEAAFDAAGISVPGFNAPSGPDASAQAEQDNQDVMSFTQPSGGSTPVGTQESQQAQDGSGPGFDPGTSYETSNPPKSSFLQSALDFADKYFMPSQRGPGFLAAGLGPLSFVPGLVSRGAEALGLKAGDFYGGQGGFDSDLAGLSTPSQSEIDDTIARMTPPDTGDDGDPDLGDPQQAAAALAYVPPVYQTYAGLGLPSVSPIPPLRRVTVPISSFVV